FHLPLNAFLIVLEVRLGTLQQAAELVAFLFQGGYQAAQRFQISEHGRTCLRFRVDVVNGITALSAVAGGCLRFRWFLCITHGSSSSAGSSWAGCQPD